MARYIINDNGQDAISVYDNNTEKFGHKTYHVYHDESRRNYPYSEFYKRVFYEDKYNIITDIRITTGNPDTDEICFVYGTERDSKSSTFGANEYYKVEIKRFSYDIDEDNKPKYQEDTDVYYVRKRTNERLMSGINIRAKNLKTLLPEKLRKVETIKRNIDRKNKVSESTETIIEDYFDTNGKFSDDVLGVISSRELKKEIDDHHDKVAESVSKNWSVTDNIRKIANTAVATGVVGGGIASAISSIQANEFTFGPIVLGIGTVLVTHHMLKGLRMSLVDTKIGQIEKAYLKENYDKVTGHRR